MIFQSYASLPEGNFKKIAAEMLTIEIYVEFLRLKFHGHFPMVHILINDVPGDFDDMATNAEWNHSGASTPCLKNPPTAEGVLKI